MSDDASLDRRTRQLLGEAGYAKLTEAMEAVQGDKSEFVARLFGLPKHSAEPQNAEGQKPYTMRLVDFLSERFVPRG